MPLHLVAGDIPGLLSSHVLKIVDDFDPLAHIIPVKDEESLWNELSQQSLWSDVQVFTLTTTTPAPLAKSIESKKHLFEEGEDLVIIVSAKLPVALKRAVEGAGGTIKEFSRRNYKKIATELLSASSLPVSVQRQVAETVGQEVERIPTTITSLLSLPPSSLKYPHVVQAYLGQDGGTPMWGILDAVDAGDPQKALIELNRTTEPPIVIQSAITAHLQRILQVGNLPGLPLPEVAKVLGVKGSTYPLQKATNLVARYKNIDGMLSLCVKAGADLRGGSSLPDELVIEILVGRLCLLTQIGKA